MPKQKRKVADCRDFPDPDNPCTLTISGSEEEVLEVAAWHAVKKHGHKNSPELRKELKEMLKDEK
jgi:hypothetical protein